MKMHESENNYLDKLPCISCKPCSFCYSVSMKSFLKTHPGHSIIADNVSGVQKT